MQDRSISFGHQTSGQPARIEWPTLCLIVVCIVSWILCLFVVTSLSLILSILLLVPVMVLHGSLTHEVCHGHPLPSRVASEVLMHINPSLAVPFLRFKDTHLAHHQDSNLTDPYDDPESNYLDPARWAQMPTWMRKIRRLNNTLAGRMVVGPALGQIGFMAQDWALIRRGNRRVLLGWLMHFPSVVIILWMVWISDIPLWAYLTACYAALGVLKVRTFLEHQAHDKCRGRTVIIEDCGIWAFLFLNNNLHVVHHMHPKIPWYRLPAVYWNNSERFLACNEGYKFASYGEIFRTYFLRAKDPVPHPLWKDGEN